MTSKVETDDSPKLHPIQLVDVKVRKLHIELNTPSTDEISIDVDSFTFSHGHSPYNAEDKQFLVFARAQINVDNDDEDETNTEESKSILTMTVELAGFFQVNEEEFSIDNIESFARTNAPLIIYPFLREHTYGLLTRVGINGVVLPLFQVPSFKIARK